MHSKNKSQYLSWWFGPIPKEHLGITRKAPREYLLKLLIHPLKRRVAKYYLTLLKGLFGLKVVGITGSAGKTTSKEMTASILGEMGKTKASHANIDPVYNIPSTILRCSPLTRYLVLEMGVEYPGEMDFYLWMAKPDIALITNTYPTHTAFFKNTQGVAKEKGKLAETLKKNKFLVLYKDNKYLRDIAKRTKAETVWFGEGEKISAENIAIRSDASTDFTLVYGKSKINVRLNLIGRQFVNNALGAAAIAYCLGTNIKKVQQGLEKIKPLEHRMSVRRLASGAVLLDDSYNSNPQAAKEAVNTLKEFAGKRKMLVVFGDMLELGDLSLKAHRELGAYIAASGADSLIGVGQASKDTVASAALKMGEKAIWVKETNQAYGPLKKSLTKDTIVLIKGSRSVGLDKLAAKLI
jgi:UDP-N-acetylmuramoyl-tripeptide--D-alanyl-D-alanine ligase